MARRAHARGNVDTGTCDPASRAVDPNAVARYDAICAQFLPSSRSEHSPQVKIFLWPADPEAPAVPAPPSPAPGKHCVVGGTLQAAPGKHAVSNGDKMAANLLSAEVAARAVSAVDEAVETVRTLPAD